MTCVSFVCTILKSFPGWRRVAAQRPVEEFSFAFFGPGFRVDINSQTTRPTIEYGL
jgi:hypothetical protein